MRTQARNCKSQAETFEDEQREYEEILAAQLTPWKKILPSLINRFAKMKDPRNPYKIKHKIAVVMVFGLFQFLFRQKSRRDFNENLTTPTVFNILSSFFPEINSTPHADTIARVLERIDLAEVEAILINLIRQLIKDKKFKKLLIQKCLPISIDGTQKVVRDGQLQEEGWLLRTISTKEGEKYQQYVYVLEANITFANGLTIPLLTEYCYLDVDLLDDPQAKQDCGTPRGVYIAGGESPHWKAVPAASRIEF